MMWSPAFSELTMVAVTALPLAKARPYSPPSTLAMAASKAARVGLPVREYS
jgi:hypothetical protein